MNGAAPSLVRVGMAGNFSGKNYRVVGRVTMGETEGGETYYWNEFNLVSDEGESATLVFEATESGGQWRMFTYFEPSNPIAAPEAATKRVGNWVDLDGTNARITLVGQSRVYEIEGEAPEGVERGDVANYFNAEAGHRMIVVSWTGDEVECYHGITITSAMVATAFNIDPTTMARESLAARANFADDDDESEDEGESTGVPISSGFLKMIAVIGAIAAVIVAVKWKSVTGGSSSAVKRYSAPALTITNGAVGQLRGTNYRVTGRTEVEMAEVSVVAKRHELHLRDDAVSGALLVNEFTPGGKDWGLFTPLQVAAPLTPQKAGGIRAGQLVEVGGNQVRIENLCRTTVLVDNVADPSELMPGQVLFGFSGFSGSNTVFARWNENVIRFYIGQRIDAKEVAAAFQVK